jgi:radical SAM protein with 4Fe4S-binding SPASM domain
MLIDRCVVDLSNKFNVIGLVNCDNYDPASVDLYNQIKSFYRESYDSQDRLIFIITKDFYKKESNCGLRLQSLQAVLNDIDISNFFVCLVTSNPEIANEYQWILDNISTDKISFNIYHCADDYERVPATDQSAYIKYLKLQDSTQVEKLSPRQKHLLFESESFCMIPWTSLMIDPSSNVKPCCEYEQTWGDCSLDSLQKIWNSESAKKLRTDMLAGIKPESCRNCHVKENLGRDTLRKSTNRRFVNLINKVDATHDDGYLEDYSLNYLDARFNNLCNLACRMCGPHLSSSWHKPALAIGKIDKSVSALKIAGKNNFDILDQIMLHLDSLQCIYFAGGEPMIIDQFYKIVEALDARGRHDVELIYNTNMTKSSLGNRSIFDLWKNFKKISIGASLDGEYQRGEYLRSGLHWQDVIDFRKQLLEHRPDIDFYVSATISTINALHLPDFHRSWVEQGFIGPEDFNLQLLLEPRYLRVDAAPERLKTLIREKYLQHLDWLVPRDPVGRAVFGFQSVLNYLDNGFEFDAKEFWQNIDPLDRYYGQELLAVFPELSHLPGGQSGI